MRIAYIIPGSGGSFYCENCMRDSTLMSALRGCGFDMLQIPMYLPLFAHDIYASTDSPIFYGAVSLYLKQRYPLFRRMPRWLERLLDTRPLLALAAAMAGSTRAAGLEEMTISMLLGAQGGQKADLDRLADWLSGAHRPDLIHLSNALLLGLAEPLKERFGIPVVCSLQDEHTWVEPMEEPNRQRVWGLLHAKAAAVDRFLAVSAYYKNEMVRLMQIDPEKIAVIPPGVDPQGYRCRAVAPAQPVVGFLSRINEGSGLDELVAALAILINERGLPATRLEVYGGMTGDDIPYVKKTKKLIRGLSLQNHVSLVTSYDRKRRFEMLSRLCVLCVPRKEPEAFGFFLLEALASGVPVVEPALGAFPEIINATRGGVLYPPGDVRALADALYSLLADPERAVHLGAAGCAAVRRDFSLESVASRIGALYRQLG